MDKWRSSSGNVTWNLQKLQTSEKEFSDSTQHRAWSIYVWRLQRHSEASECDIRLFWKLIRQLKPGEDTSHHSDFFATVENNYSDLKHAHSLSTEFPGGPVSVDEIQTFISNLNRRKASGIDRVQNEHFIYVE